MAIVIETTAGMATIDLCIDERPKACMNFLKLCQAKYFNNNIIFSIERNFIAQMGDPTNTGRGGKSIFAKMYGEQARFFEEKDHPILRHDNIGVVSMVNCGSKGNLYGSQFIITLGEHVSSLDGSHLVFGYVSEGFELLQTLNCTITDESNRPFKDILITHTVVLEDPFPDPDGLTFPRESPPPPSLETFEDSKYIPFYEDINDYNDLSEEQIKELIEEREAKARATILHMVQDLPDEDAAPPENVLFVCKLNPVTTSEDLEIIFSRFGKIVSCEVIKDKLTDKSLQYAFIEFDNSKACEDAYFKMDNVLIDERRIHVDFSQSVSKMRWKGKGRLEHFDDKKGHNSRSGRSPSFRIQQSTHRKSPPRKTYRSPSPRNRSSRKQSRRSSPYQNSYRTHCSPSPRDRSSHKRRSSRSPNSYRKSHRSPSPRDRSSRKRRSTRSPNSYSKPHRSPSPRDRSSRKQSRRSSPPRSSHRSHRSPSPRDRSSSSRSSHRRSPNRMLKNKSR